MSKGRIGIFETKALTKEEFILLIERNFPDSKAHENIVIITEVNSDDGKYQSVTFGKILE